MALVLAAGCSTTTGDASTSPYSVQHPREREEDPRVAYERAMAHEYHGLGTHPVRLLDGVVKGSVEARTAPKHECETNNAGFGCKVELELGEDAGGDLHAIHCLVSTDFEPFGPIVKAFLGPTWLIEPPSLAAEDRGEGIAVTFVANNEFESETGRMAGTAKVSSLYAQGYMVTCFDGAAGGRKTFTRVVSGFFDSLQFSERPRDPAVFSMAYRIREGDRTTGFRYGFVTTDGKSNPRFTEHSTSFSLMLGDGEWKVHDSVTSVVRTADSAVERYRRFTWWDGKGPRVLSAKPSEDGRLRIKTEIGQRVDALELTPKAALDTELWAAARLQRLATNQTEQYVYAWPIVDDGDPSLGYIVLSPGSAGVVMERFRSHRRFDEAPDPARDVRDELHVDERGMVTKEVTSTAINELLYARGEIPGSAPEGAAVVASASTPRSGSARGGGRR